MGSKRESVKAWRAAHPEVVKAGLVKLHAWDAAHPEWVRERRRRWYNAHKENHKRSVAKYLAKHGDRVKQHALQERRNLRLEVLAHYGNGTIKCAICNETREGCLSIDHIDGRGGEERRRIRRYGGTNFYRWLRQQGFPPGYQTLCMNCQFLKERGDCG